MKIGIIGGSFNPPHIGHLILAAQAKGKFDLDKVIFIPCFLPPHKNLSGIIPAEMRLKMLKLALGRKKGFFASDIEIKRKGISYTIDTLRSLHKRYRRDLLYLIIGADLARGFLHWKDYQEILKLVKVVVASRGNIKGSFPFPCLKLKIPQIDISSSFIRKQVKAKKDICCLVPEAVEEFILRNKLYQERSKI